jgi:hypothetical protein
LNTDADPAGDGRQGGTENVGEGHFDVNQPFARRPDRAGQENEDQDGEHTGETGKQLIFRFQERISAGLDPAADFTDVSGSGGQLLDPEVKIHRYDERQQGDNDCEDRPQHLT